MINAVRATLRALRVYFRRGRHRGAGEAGAELALVTVHCGLR